MWGILSVWYRAFDFSPNPLPGWTLGNTSVTYRLATTRRRAHTTCLRSDLNHRTSLNLDNLSLSQCTEPPHRTLRGPNLTIPQGLLWKIQNRYDIWWPVRDTQIDSHFQVQGGWGTVAGMDSSSYKLDQGVFLPTKVVVVLQRFYFNIPMSCNSFHKYNPANVWRSMRNLSDRYFEPDDSTRHSLTCGWLNAMSVSTPSTRHQHLPFRDKAVSILAPRLPALAPSAGRCCEDGRH